MISNRLTVPAAVALVIVVAVGGCTRSTGGAGGGSTAGSDPIKAVDINAQPRDKVREGGTLRWPIEQFPAQWNLNHLDGTNGSVSSVMTAMMPQAFTTDEKAALSVNKDYVLSAELTATSPRQVVTYRLNPAAHWSDGTPITWRDYAAEATALSGRDAAFEVASTAGYEQVERVTRGGSPFEVVVTFTRPYSEWQSLFDPLYPASTNENPTRFNSGWVDKMQLTAGPFKLGRIDPVAKSVTIVRDPKWWGDPAKLDRIVYRTMDPEAQVNAFANGEVDLFDIGPDADFYKRASAVHGASIRQAAGPDYRHFTLNGTSPILSDLAVRRAVAHAIDRTVIARADLSGLNWPAVSVGNHFFVNTQEGYQDNSREVASYDPGKAKALLDAAGWRLSGAVRRKGDKELKLRFVIPSGVAIAQQEAQLTQSMLTQVGMQLDIQAVPPDAFFDRYVIPGNFDITPFSWVGTPYPVTAARSIYQNPAKDAKGELQIEQNYARIGSARIDALMDKALAEFGPAKSRADLNAADREVWQEVHSLPLFQRPQITAAKATLANFGSFGFRSTTFQDIGFVG